MPLTLVLGPANSAKAGEVFAAFARGGAHLVVPTARDAEAYAREQRGVFGAVVTFAGLIGEISRRAGLVPRVIGPVARARVLRELGDTPGFGAALGDLVAELGRGLITPQRFAQALAAVGREDVGRLPLAYARALERLGVVDAELAARRALDALRADPGCWGAGPVLFYGFDDLTLLERDAVEVLARVADVHVSLNYEPGREALAARAEVAESLRPLAERVIELEAVDEHYAPVSRGALHHLERGLFEPGVGRVDAGGAVSLLEAGGERAEAELVAAEVLARLRGGARAEEIVVVARDPGPLTALFARVFGAYGLTLSASRRLPLRFTALGRGLRALARCAFSPEADAADLLAYLRAPGVLRSPEPIDRLEAALRRSAIADLAAARELSGLELGEIDGLATAGEPAGELLRQARRLLALPHRGLAEPIEAGEAAALAALAGAVAELSELFGPLGGDDLLELLDELQVEVPAAAGGVLFTDPLSIRARRFRHVLVCDLQEGSFPRLEPADPFLPDEVRFRAAHETGLALRSPGDALSRERYLFYACLSRATETVTLAYRISDEEGNLALASPFVQDVGDLFEGLPVRRRLLADVVWRADEAPSAREAARAAVREGTAAVRERRLGPEALARVRHTRVVSPGALESYGECPVKWLVERQLEPEPLEPKPEPLVRGSFVHDVLEGLLRRLGGPLSAGSLPRAEALLDELAAELPAELLPGESAGLREAARLRIVAELRRLLRFEADAGLGWRPERLEQDFGFDSEDSAPPLRLVIGEEEVVVRGKVDRIDVAPGGRRAIVRDYKSGGVKPGQPVAGWEAEQRLQVALYMLVARELLGYDVAGGVYQPLSGGKLRPRGVFRDDPDLGEGFVATDRRSAEELDAVLEDARGRAVALAARLRSGELVPCPSTCSRDGCRYPSICRA